MNIFDDLDIGISMADSTTLFSPENVHSLTTYEPPDHITTPSSVTPWPSKLPLEIALNLVPMDQLFEMNGIAKEDYIKWSAMPAFRKALSEAARQVREEGLSFRLLCQGIAQEFLPIVQDKLHDETVSFAIRMDAFKTISKYAGLEPKEEKVQQNNANTVQIQINL